MERPVAVCNLDGLYEKTLSAMLVERCIFNGLFPEAARTLLALPDTKRLAKLGAYLKGLPYDMLEDVASGLIEEERGKVLSFAKKTITALKARGKYLLAVSSAPRFLVDGFAYEAGFDKSYGSFFSTGPSDKFTGLVEDEEVITNKASCVMRTVRKEKLTLAGSTGIGSMVSDIGMLELIETPLVFNPDKELEAHAKKRGWKIVLEEHNVIYQW